MTASIRADCKTQRDGRFMLTMFGSRNQDKFSIERNELRKLRDEINAALERVPVQPKLSRVNGRAAAYRMG